MLLAVQAEIFQLLDSVLLLGAGTSDPGAHVIYQGDRAAAGE